jgi:predicted esterase
VPDWRWLLERGDSPWYPTARLFRQPERGDWDSVVQALREALAALASKEDGAPRQDPSPA